jgi:hypothetical protein
MMSSSSGSGSLLSGVKMSTGMMAFVVIWALAGLSALLMSIYCTYQYPDSNPNQNLMGFALAILLGPFYWIYYYYAKKGYCGRT